MFYGEVYVFRSFDLLIRNINVTINFIVSVFL